MPSDATPTDESEKSQLRELVLDDLERRFDTFQALRKSDGAAADVTEMF